MLPVRVIRFQQVHGFHPKIPKIINVIMLFFFQKKKPKTCHVYSKTYLLNHAVFLCISVEHMKLMGLMISENKLYHHSFNNYTKYNAQI